MINDREVWERIAESFDKTRKKPWLECLEFIDSIERPGNFLDIGCGNGRHLIPAASKSKFVFGIDISFGMLNICRKNLERFEIKNASLIQADALHLPLKSESFDYVMFIATLHNIRYRERRIEALKEVRRVLKKDGKGLISVWSRWQGRFLLYFLKEFFKRSEREFGDIDIMWKKDKLDLPRFYHLYSKREFFEDIVSAGLEVERITSVRISSRFLRDNYFAIVGKG